MSQKSYLDYLNSTFMRTLYFIKLIFTLHVSHNVPDNNDSAFLFKAGNNMKKS